MKKLFTLLMLLLCVGGGKMWADETIFSAVCNVTTSDEVAASTTNQAITAAQATISGGSMSVSNSDTKAYKYVDYQGESGNKKGAFCIAASKASFKLTLSQAVQVGDRINCILYTANGSTTIGLKLNGTTLGDVTTPATTAWTAMSTYTVTAEDGIAGQTELTITRTQGKGTYFTNFTITRAADARTATTLAFATTSGSQDINDNTSFTLPSLTATPNVAAITEHITYASNNTAVATVNATTGAVTLVKKGTAKITASFAGDEDYQPSSADFTLTVEDRESFDPADYNIVTTYDFTAMANTTLVLSSTAEGKIYNKANSINNNVFRCTNSGLESLAVQAAYDGNKKGWKIENGSGKGLLEGSGAGRCAAICDIKTGWIVEFYHTSGTTFETRNNQDADANKDDGIKKKVLLAESGHHVFQAESDGMLGFELTKGKYVNRIIIYTSESPKTLTFGKGDADGYAPAEISAYEGAYCNLPINQSLSKAGYTLTGWNDGVTTYTPGQRILGPSSNKTFSPVFTANTTSLTRSDSETVITWDFRISQVSLNYESKDGYYVKQVKVNGVTSDVPMAVDATPGKLKNQGRSDQWCQINENTTLTIPAVKGMNIVMNVYRAFGTDGQTQTQIAGSTEYVLSNSNMTATYTYNGNAETIDIVAGSDIQYVSTIVVTYPAAVSGPADPVQDEDNLIITTTDNMDGWRSFYDATKDYTVDANTKVYVATAKAGSNEVTMTTIDNIPAGTPVVLKTTAVNHQITLTAATLDDYVGTNLLEVSTAGQDLSAGALRLGYGATNGVGFYLWKSGSAEAGVVYLPTSVFAGSRNVTMVFDDETTGISQIENGKTGMDNSVYNLNGQRVNANHKGIVIKNGKKVFVK